MRARHRATQWIDASQHDPGITLLELLARLADLFTSYQERIAEEERLRTRRRYVLAVVALAGLACWFRQGARRG
jgi:hypothetical protein